MARHRRWEYYNPIRVFCKKCDEWIDEREVEFLNIEEGMRGEDRETFRCPKCHKKSTSSRVRG